MAICIISCSLLKCATIDRCCGVKILFAIVSDCNQRWSELRRVCSVKMAFNGLLFVPGSIGPRVPRLFKTSLSTAAHRRLFQRLSPEFRADRRTLGSKTTADKMSSRMDERAFAAPALLLVS